MKLPASPDRSDLIERARAAAAELALLPPVDRALFYADQRASFARGMLSDKTDRVAAEARIAADPVNVLAAEVRRLRGELAKFESLAP